MSYSVPASSVIDYPAEAMASFPIYAFEWIDNLHFSQPPDRFLPDPSAHVEATRAAFLRAGLEGTGEVGLLWLPTFVFPMRSWPSWDGVALWHVKQVEDGTSWLMSPIELPFRVSRDGCPTSNRDRLDGHNDAHLSHEVSESAGP